MGSPVLRRSITVFCAFALLVPACGGLKDADPFQTNTVNIRIDEFSGEVFIEPAIVYGDWSYGQVQINNTTADNHGFAIDELAIYQTIIGTETPIIGISDAQDDKTYVFYCHLHNPDGIDGLPEDQIEFRGELVIDYRTEEKI